MQSPQYGDGLNKTSENLHFDKVKTMLNKHNFQPHEIFNCDESGLTCVHKPVKVIAPKGKRCLSSVTSAERGQTITLLVAFSASGTYIPPMMIFNWLIMLSYIFSKEEKMRFKNCIYHCWGNIYFRNVGE